MSRQYLWWSFRSHDLTWTNHLWDLTSQSHYAKANQSNKWFLIIFRLLSFWRLFHTSQKWLIKNNYRDIAPSLCESKKCEHFALILTWSNRKKNSQETQIYTLLLQKSFAKIAIIKNKYREKIDQFLAKENPALNQSVHTFLIRTVMQRLSSDKLFFTWLWTWLPCYLPILICQCKLQVNHIQ